ncbi:MAG: SUMF1/EgtB/PvdO family nonheme iron enzyme [Saprospiraceae bacterium]|nr:SUMF1/EgtB/PvdO family nonheme iron enzyme [Saprospiraceae bacterium]
MNKILASFLGLMVMSMILPSCGKSGKGLGELTGVPDRPKWKAEIPFGMAYIKSGTFQVGSGDEDISRYYISRPKTISLQGFYMDETEISNNEYRQFVHWVRDSIAHSIMGDYYEDDYGNERIDWELDIDWSDETLEDMYYSGDDMVGTKRELDARQLVYGYEWMDFQAAARDRGRSPRSSFIKKFKLNIFPDTLCWIRDFSYSYNDPIAKNYFSHPAYDDYPVVGLTWAQANAFCNWRSSLWNNSRENSFNDEFRLPTEVEWEYAARGGNQNAMYPWGDPYIRNAKGCLLANFKPGRGNYPEDGGQYTLPVDAYDPNGYGLYNMAGNVSEWTRTAFVENAYGFMHDLNPDITYEASEDDPEAFKRKVIRGGSWKDIGYFLRVNTRHWEYQDTSKSYIGFRCILPYQGRSLNDFRGGR